MEAADAQAKKREAVWITKKEEEINADEAELCKLLDAKEQELYARHLHPSRCILIILRLTFPRAKQDRKFKSDIRSLITSVLSAPSSIPSVRVEAKTRRVITEGSDTEADPRPGHAHVTLLIEKGEKLLTLYKYTNEAISKAPSIDNQLQKYAKDKEDVEHMLVVGKQVAQRRIDEVLQNGQPETSTKRKNVRVEEPRSEEELKLAGELFGRKSIVGESGEGEVEAEGEGGSEQPDTAEALLSGPGVYRLLHDAERGVKRLAGNLPFLETDPASSEV